jgi:hypothetical protein
MKLATCLLMISMCVAAQAQRGTIPRESAQQYPVGAEGPAASLGVRLLTPAEVKKTFSAEMNWCCLVVEVAIFPPKDGTVTVSMDDFALRAGEVADAPLGAELLSARLQQEKPPAPKQETGVTTTGRVGVGYESGGVVNSRTGERRGGGVYTSTGGGVGVGVGSGGKGSPEQERKAIEIELRARNIPEGETARPVAGYLYFSPPVKKDKKAPLQLEYTLNGEKVTLDLR